MYIDIGKTTYHLDFEQGFVAIVQKVTCLSAIDPHHTQEELPTQAQGHWRLPIHNGAHTTLDVGLQDMCLGEFALEVGREPDASQRPGLGQKCLGIEHCISTAAGR